MFNHPQPDYICPICLGIQGIESEQTMLKQADLVYKDEQVCAFINSLWIGRNEGHVIIVPTQHYEHIYDLPTNVGNSIFALSQKISLALKETYQCDGITLRQNNEPAGDQHAFHYHLHIFPRYHNDNFNQELTKKSRLSDPRERLVYAEKMKHYLDTHT